jgi:hypothetical protein
MQGIRFALGLLLAGVAHPGLADPADDALAALAPLPEIPALEALAHLDCTALNDALVKQVALNHYAKPDGENALLVLTAQARKGCPNNFDGTPAVTARQGIASTLAYLGELDRKPEACAIADVMERAAGASDSPRKLADFRMAYCREPATTPWTQADTQAVAARTERAIEISSVLGKMRVAMRGQHLFSPAGDNAIEYALEGRTVAGDPKRGAEFESALMDLLPYAIIAAEQASARHDQTELARLIGLIARADPQAPALARLRTLMDSN